MGHMSLVLWKTVNEKLNKRRMSPHAHNTTSMDSSLTFRSTKSALRRLFKCDVYLRDSGLAATLFRWHLKLTKKRIQVISGVPNHPSLLFLGKFVDFGQYQTIAFTITQTHWCLRDEFSWLHWRYITQTFYIYLLVQYHFLIISSHKESGAALMGSRPATSLFTHY